MTLLGGSFSAADARCYEFGPRFEPAWRVGPGQSFVVETADCFSERLGVAGSLARDPDGLAGLNPATGPFFVEGTLPGDALAVGIGRITLGSVGVLAASPEAGLLRRHVLAPARHEVFLDGHTVRIADQVNLPMRPMVGLIGVATDGEAWPTTMPGRHGGNLDVRDLGRGATIILPIAQPGAGLAIGDLHAAQGDGEIMQSGVEAAGLVTIRLRVLRAQAPRWPWIRTRRHWMVATAAPTIEEAARVAAEEMAREIARSYGVDLVRAGMVLSACADLRVNQIVNPWVGVRLAVPRASLPALRIFTS